MEEMLRMKYAEGTWSFHALQVSHSPQISTCSPTWKLSKPYPFGFFMETQYIGMINEIIGHMWLNSIFSPFPLPGGAGGGGETESFTP